MDFNPHLDLKGQHAFLGASKYHWINYDEDDLYKRINTYYATEIGTLLHNEACKHIKHGFKLTNYDKKSVVLELLDNGIPEYVMNSIDFDSIFNNLKTYVNDAIGFKMTPEQVLYYSKNCFGTADTISFNKHDILRIHDYKSGTTPAHMEQLYVYAALFCLEYMVKPGDIQIETRIYQNNDIFSDQPNATVIGPIMDKIVYFDKLINELKERA